MVARRQGGHLGRLLISPGRQRLRRKRFARGAALRGLFAAAGTLAPADWPRLTVASLIDAAGVTPDAPAREGLARLLAALDAASALTLFGRLSLRWDAVRLLRNAALVDAAHARRPELGAPVAQPIFILGLPRSGTSFLHGLLAADPQMLAPRNWQTIYPAPRPADFDPAADRRVRAVDRQLRLFAGLAPGFEAMHPVGGDSPQECSEITAQVFESYRFDTVFRVPDYLAWLSAHGDLDGFAYHRRFLQFLQDGYPARWVLKCPDHVFSLAAIRATYPDARFVAVHRDPLQVLASNAQLTEILRRAFTRNVDPLEIGALERARWREGAHRLLTLAGHEADRMVHLRHHDLIAAPLTAVATIYRRFGIELTDAAETAMATRLRRAPDGGYAPHAAYPLERFGLDAQTLRRDFAAYVARFRLEATPSFLQ